MISTDKPTARCQDVVIQELRGELLIYDLKINKAYCLNETAATVYRSCDGSNSITEISRLISINLKSSVSEDLVWLAVDQLADYNLLTNSQELKINFDEQTRRAFIKKVGFASLVTLPLVSSLIAPTAVMAQSGASVGGTSTACQPCTSNADCAPGAGTCITRAPGNQFCGFGIGRPAEDISLCPAAISGTPACQDHCENSYPNASFECCSGKATSNNNIGCACTNP